MSLNIVRFEQCAYVSLAFNLISIVIGQQKYGLLGAWGEAAIIGVLFAALIWGTARRRNRWAKWIYAVLIVVSSAGAATTLWTGEYWAHLAAAPVFWSLQAAALAFAIGSLYFLFAREKLAAEGPKRTA